MFRNMKQHQGFQWILQGINYYLTIGVYGSFLIDNFIGWFDLSLSDSFGPLYNFFSFFYPIEFVLVLFLTIGFFNFILLDFKKNQLIFASFILNTMAWTILLIGLLLFYWASL